MNWEIVKVDEQPYNRQMQQQNMEDVGNKLINEGNKLIRMGRIRDMSTRYQFIFCQVYYSTIYGNAFSSKCCCTRQNNIKGNILPA